MSSNHARFVQNPGRMFQPNLPPKQRQSSSYEGARSVFINSKESAAAPRGLSKSGNYHISRPANLASFGTGGQLSITSADDDATTTTSGSYVINPDEIKIDTYIGSDIIV